MVSTQEWADHQEILKTTSRLQVNLHSWEEGDITHFYQDMQAMFAELDGDDIRLTKRERRIIDMAYTSFRKIFNSTKSPGETFLSHYVPARTNKYSVTDRSDAC